MSQIEVMKCDLCGKLLPEPDESKGVHTEDCCAYRFFHTADTDVFVFCAYENGLFPEARLIQDK